MTKIPEKLGSEYYRSFLTPQGQAFYDRIHTQLLRRDYTGQTIFSIDQPETAAADAFAAYKAVRDDHPEYFYLGLKSRFTWLGRSGTLKYPILYAPDRIERIRKQLRKSVYLLVRGTAALGTLDRETLVYERIARKLTYTDHNDIRDHNIVGPILLSSGVCEGYNALLLLCFRRIGIPCIKVYGKTKSDGWHCWTIAWIDGVPVHCDVTWDRMTEGIVRFDYLNLSDEEIAADHHDFKGSHLPVCTSQTLGYYDRNGLCVYSFSELTRRLQQNRAAGVSPILLHFGYTPASGDCLKEIQRALAAGHTGGYKLYYNPDLKNVAIKKIERR